MNKTYDFIRKAKLKHGNTYDYSKVIYNGAHNKVIIICKIHDEFEQTATNHISRAGCPKCANIRISMKQRSNINEFVEKARQIHGDTYDYSKVDYTSNHVNVIITCKTHGEFEQTPHSHLSRSGCRKCGIITTANKRRKGKIDFIEQAMQVHGDKYEYIKVEYNSTNKNVIITCKMHGDFEQRPGSHLQGCGCPTCGILHCANQRRSNTDEFIEKAKKVHGHTYEYNNVEYIDCITKVSIICKIHGEFEQTPGNHLQGQACQTCGWISLGNQRRSNADEFIEKSQKVHGDTYEYSKVDYIDAISNVIITCKTHGEFEQTPHSHLSGRGCSACGIIYQANQNRKTTDQFIEQSKSVHGDIYEYNKSNYIDCITKVSITCKIHGEFEQIPGSHLQGIGCPTCGIIQCANKRRSNTVEFIKKAQKVHGDTYEYNKSDYVGAKLNIMITCKIHGEFSQTPNNHLRGTGCPSCSIKTEGKLRLALQSRYPSLQIQFNQDWCQRKRFDFCIPEHNIIVELDGPQHFRQISNWQSPEDQFETDKYKEKCANDNNYSVIRLLQEDIWLDKYDWCKELCDAIEEIKLGDDIINIYLCKNNEYGDF